MGTSTTAERFLDVCSATSLAVTNAVIGPAVTGGGGSISFDIVATTACRLVQPPGLAILDRTGRTITFGVVSLSDTDVVDPGANLVIGEWRDVCSPTIPPLRIEVLLQNLLHIVHSVEADGSGQIPTCFGPSGDITTPTAVPPSGFLLVGLHPGA